MGPFSIPIPDPGELLKDVENTAGDPGQAAKIYSIESNSPSNPRWNGNLNRMYLVHRLPFDEACDKSNNV